MPGLIGNWIRRWQRPPTLPVLVYQMGKVGSSTVHQSLAGAGVAVEQIQFLTPRWINQVSDQYRLAGSALPQNLSRSQEVSARILAAPDRQWKVISLVRDPVARNISSLFETLDPLHPDLMHPDGSLDVPAVMDKLQEQFSEFDESTDYVCNWFRQEPQQVFGTDVFAWPFDLELGYQRIIEPRLDWLVMRLEDLDAVFETAMQQFFGRPGPFPLIRANVAAEKRWSTAWQHVHDQLRLPLSVCEAIYQSRFCRHFYSDHQRRNFIDRWSCR